MAIKIKGIFRGLSNPKELTAQIQYSNQKNIFDGMIKTFKNDKFQFPPGQR